MGAQNNTYTFDITNNGPDGIYRVIVTIPSGFTSIASASCPSGMTPTEVSSTQVICLGDPFEPTTQILNTASAQVLFSATSPTPGSDTLYTWSVATRDTTGTSAVNTSAQTNVDVTAPTIFSIMTKDADADGKVDTATVIFSENVLDSTFSASNFTIGGVAATTINTGTANDNTFDVVLASGIAGTEAKQVTYTQGVGTDIAGNLLANVTDGTVVETDGASPILLSVQTKTTTTIDLTFSEDLDGTTATNADFSVAGFTLGAPDAFEVTPGVVRLTTTVSFGTDVTPAVSYVGMVKDLADNVAPIAGPITPSDGVAPIISSTQTVSTTQILVTFSEAMSAVVGTDFTVAGNTLSSVSFTPGASTATFTLGTPIGTGATPLVSTIVSPTGTRDNSSATNLVTGGLSSTPTDGIAPTVVITATTATSPTNTSPIAMTITFSENVTGLDIGEIVVGNGTAANLLGSGAVYTFDITLPGQGTVTVNIAEGVAQDVSSNSNANTAAPQFSIVFDSIAPDAPTVALLDPVNNANKTAATLHIVGESGATYNYSIEDATPGSPVTGTGTLTGGDLTVSGINVTGLDDGTLTASVTLTDAATNTGVAGTDTAMKDVVTPSAPTTPDLTAATDSNIDTDDITKDATPDFTTTAEAGSTIVVYDEATSVGTMTATGGTDTITVSTLSAGVHSITVKATDPAGNTSSASSALSVTIDTSAPTAVLSAATDDIGSVTGALTSGQTTDDTALVLSGTNESGSTVQVFDGTDSVAPAIVTGTTWSYTATVANGTTYQFNVKETDVAGNTSSATANFTVIGDTSAPDAPVITFIATDGKINDSEKATVHVIGIAEANSTVSVTLTGVAIAGPTTGSANGLGAFDIILDTTSLTDGTVTPSVTATDAAGNVSTAATTPTATKDVVAPNAPTTPDLTAATDSNINTDDITKDPTPDFTITAEIGSTIVVYDGTTPVGSMTATGGTDTITVSTLSDGVHSITVKTTDVAGNESPASGALSVTVDTIPPTSSITSPTADVVVKNSGGDVSLVFDATGGSTCEYKVDDGSYTALTNCTSPQTITLTDHRKSIVLKVTDTAGNSTESSAVSFVVDTNDNLTVASSGADFTTIQAAVDGAMAGDTISIAAGTYAEAVTIDKALVLTGTGAPTATSFTLNSGANVAGSSGITASTVTVNSGAKIQDGVLLTSSGGTVNVAAGTYAESVTVDKTLTVQKDASALTKPIIQANDNWGFKLLGAADITVDGFEIQITGGGSTNDQAVRLENADGAIIKNNTITTTADTALGI